VLEYRIYDFPKIGRSKVDNLSDRQGRCVHSGTDTMTALVSLEEISFGQYPSSATSVYRGLYPSGPPEDPEDAEVHSLAMFLASDLAILMLQ
jgi:hypothetical protein